MKKKNKFLLIICILIFTFAFKVNAAETLIEINNKITVTTDTTVEDIVKVLGEAKVKTISPFGGYAYTFYTDDNYSNYLYIETTDEDKIISYGSVDKNYSVPKTNTNGATLVDDSNDLSGYFYTDENNKIIGGIYYNPSVLENGNTEKIIYSYNVEYDKYTIEYQSGMARHIVPMYNALARRLGKEFNLQYSDGFELYYNDFYSSTSLEFETLEEKDLAFAKLTTCVLNPLHFASMIKGNLERDYSKNNIAFFGYDKKVRKIYGYVTDYKKADDAIFNRTNEGVYSRDYFSSVYALNLLDDNMTETEKALVLAQFTQYGKLLDSNDNNYYDKENEKEESWYNYYFNDLANKAGLSCEIVGIIDGLTLNICYLDDEWTYIDVTKKANNTFEPYPYARIEFNLNFKGRDTIESSNLKDKYTFDSDLANYPRGVDKEIDNYSSMVYYDKDYKYYEKSANRKTYIYKEDRTTHEKEQLQETLYHINGTGLVKDNDNLYYVGTDGSLYSYNLKSKSNNKIASVDANKTIASVYLDEKGIVSYGIYDDENQQNEIGKTNIRLESWPREKTYYFDDNNYKYKYLYLETPTNATIVAINNYGDNNIKFNMPDKIKNKPVVGIMQDAFWSLERLSGELIFPKYLEYIGSNAFYGLNYNSTCIEKIEFNSNLKSIGYQAFAFANICSNSIIIPDSVKYIGANAFESPLIETKELKIGSGLKYLNTNLFNLNKSYIRKIVIPEGIKYIFNEALPATGAVILPKSLISIGNNYIEELFLKSKDTIISSTNDVYYLTPDFTDIVELKQSSYDDNTSGEYRLNHEPFKLYYNIKPKYYFDETKLTWESTNSNVAKVDNEGNVTLVGKGDTTIKLISSNGGVGTYDLKVIGLNLNYEKYEITSLNQTLKLKATDSKYNQDQYVTWKSSNSDVAEVDSYGNVTAKKSGTTKITATSSDYGTAECTINVNLPIDLGDGTKGYIGDINGNSNVEVSDAIEALKYYVEIYPTTEKVLKLADFNKNNKIDVTDAVEILKLYVSK